MKRGGETLHVDECRTRPPAGSLCEENSYSSVDTVESRFGDRHEDGGRVPSQVYGAQAMRAFSVADSSTWPAGVQDVGLPYVLEKSAHENVRGRYELVQLHSDEVVKLSQVRRERNRAGGQLKADIYERSQNNVDESLINPIDVAYVDEAQLVEYLEFVRKTWGSSATLEEFSKQRTAEGKYFLIIAGHSRHQAIQELEEEHAEDGTFNRVPIEMKVHTVNTVWDIIRAQIGENISSNPGPERQAIAIVEAYYYGLGKDWNNEEEFIERCGIEGMTDGVFGQAMNFAALPDAIRSFVLGGPVNYKTGVEIGKCVPLLKELFYAKHGGELEQSHLEEMLKRECAILVNTIVEENKGITAAGAFLEGQRKEWREVLAMIKGKKRGMLQLDMISQPDATLDEQSRRLRNTLRRLGRRRGLELTEVIEINAGVIGDKEIIPFLKDAVVATERGATAVRRHMAKAAADQAAEDAYMADQELFA